MSNSEIDLKSEIVLLFFQGLARKEIAVTNIGLFTNEQPDTDREKAVLPHLSHISELDEKVRDIASNESADYCVTCGRPGTDHIFLDSTGGHWFISAEGAHKFYSLYAVLLFGFK